MNCKYHNKKEGNIHCNMCQSPLCKDCILNIDGEIYCKDCLSKKYKNETSKIDDKNYVYSSNAEYINKKSTLLAIIFTFIVPGSGQLYLGYMKKGICIFLGFILGGIFIPIVSLIIYILTLLEKYLPYNAFYEYMSRGYLDFIGQLSNSDLISISIVGIILISIFTIVIPAIYFFTVIDIINIKNKAKLGIVKEKGFRLI